MWAPLSAFVASSRHARLTRRDSAPHLRGDARLLGLVALLVCEILVLAGTLDTQRLDALPSAWAAVVGWSPHCLRIATTVSLAAFHRVSAIFFAADRIATDEISVWGALWFATAVSKTLRSVMSWRLMRSRTA